MAGRLLSAARGPKPLRSHLEVVGQDPPLVSVVIATRNRLAFLREAVASVRAQTLGNWELIVVDDASSDGTAEWLGTEEACPARAILLCCRRERSAARNAGLAQARGEWVMFLDDDDLLVPEALELLYRRTERASGLVAVAGACLRLEERGPWRPAHPHLPRLFREPWRHALLGWWPAPGRTVFRAEAVREAGGWDEAMSVAEDHELWLRVGKAGSLATIPQVVTHIRVHGGQTNLDGADAVVSATRARFVASLQPGDLSWARRALWAEHLLAPAPDRKDGGRWSGSLDELRAVFVCPLLIWSPAQAVPTRRAVRQVLGLGLRHSARSSIASSSSS
jgi:hypothetical protein